MDGTIAPDANHRQSQRKHILAVSHNPEFLDVVRVLLQGETYNVTTTNYVPRTWAQIAALQPSLLLIGLNPVHPQDGLELLEHLHHEGVTHTIPIVVTSTDHHLLQRIEREKDYFGGDRFMVIALDIDELLEAIRTLIGPA
jgi:CheY-like chemotaxis protein